MINYNNLRQIIIKINRINANLNFLKLERNKFSKKSKKYINKMQKLLIKIIAEEHPKWQDAWEEIRRKKK